MDTCPLGEAAQKAGIGSAGYKVFASRGDVTLKELGRADRSAYRPAAERMRGRGRRTSPVGLKVVSASIRLYSAEHRRAGES